MIKLIRNADVYAPAHLGKKDVLVIADKVVRIADKIEGYEGMPEVEVFDFSGKKLLPGYIDMHMHITGGGGEQGPASRVPEAMLSQITSCGITTVLGLLGTDGVTRSVENLVAKARALTEEGITAYCLTGAYGIPSPTITGSIEKDIMMVPPIIGTKIAVSDHRSSNPQGPELIEVATATRRGGLLANVAGLVTMHMGSGIGKLDPLFYALDHSDVPAKNFLPTHMLRTRELMEEGAKLVRRGGYFDMTAGSTDEDMEIGAEQIMEILSWEGMSGYQHEGRVYNLYTIINHHRDSTRSHPGTNQRTNAGQNQDCRHALSNLLADFVHHFIPGNTNAVSNQAGNSSYQKQQRLGCVTQITFADSQNNHHGNNRNNGFRKGWHTPICFFFSFLHIL